MAAKSGAVAPRVRVLRPGVFCPGRGRGRSASGRVRRAGSWRARARRRPGKEASACAKKDDGTLTIGGEYFWAISVVPCIRFAVVARVKSTSVAATRPKKPPTTHPPDLQTWRADVSESSQGGFDGADTHPVLSSGPPEGVLPRTLSTGRALAARRRPPSLWREKASREKRSVAFSSSARFSRAQRARSVELRNHDRRASEQTARRELTRRVARDVQ